MKIANIILTSVNGGAEQVFVDYSRSLKNLGHEVVAIVKQDAPYAKDVLSLGINLKKITNHFGYHDILAVRKIKKIIEEEGVEVVFAHIGRSIELVKKAVKKIKNRKVFVIGVNHSMNVKRSVGCDITISVNKKAFFKTIDAGQDENQSFVISNAIFLDDAIKEVEEVDLSLKAEINLGVIGRFDETKGFHHAINALKILEKSGKKFILNIAGGGDREKNLHKQVKDLKLENSVKFLGWIEDKKAFYSAIDILLVPSKNETFGLVLVEAMKYRKLVIASNTDGPMEIIRDGTDGLIFNIHQEDQNKIAEELAQKVLQLVFDKELANKIITNSFNRLCEKFSYHSLENSLAEIVGRV